MVIVHPMKEIMCKRQWGSRQGQGISHDDIETGAPRELKRLRKKVRMQAKGPKSIPQGLKARSFGLGCAGDKSPICQINPRPAAREIYSCERSIPGLPDQSPAYRSREFFRSL